MLPATVHALPEEGKRAVLIDGSSTVYPISEAVAEEFGSTHPNIRVSIGVSGTGGGFKKFCAGETDISEASRPIKATEAEHCKAQGVGYVELPIAYDALTIIVNPANTWLTSITVDELKKLWAPESQGTVTKWSQVNPTWPDKPIHLYGPGIDSGTFDYFTEAINGKEDASRGDYTSSEDDNVIIQGVARDPLALGFLGMSYVQENASKVKAIAVGSDKAVLPSASSVRDGSYQPLSRPLFLYVRSDRAREPSVQAFLSFYLSEGATLVEQVGYVGLSKELAATVLKRYEAGTEGTLYENGGQHGDRKSLDQLLR